MLYFGFSEVMLFVIHWHRCQVWNWFLSSQAQLQREKEQDQMKLHAKLEKLDVLEKECLRLTTTQQTAEVSVCLSLKLWCQEQGKAGIERDRTVTDWGSSCRALSNLGKSCPWRQCVLSQDVRGWAWLL